MKLPINHPGRGRRRRTATTARAKATTVRRPRVQRVWTRWAEQQWGHGQGRDGMCNDGRRVYDFARRLEDRGYTPEQIYRAARGDYNRIVYVTNHYQTQRLLHSAQAAAVQNALTYFDGLLQNAAVSDELKTQLRKGRADVAKKVVNYSKVTIVPRRNANGKYTLVLAGRDDD